MKTKRIVNFNQFSLRESKYLGSCVEVGDDNSHNYINSIFSDATEMAYYVGDPDNDDFGQSTKITKEDFLNSINRNTIDENHMKGDVGYYHIPKLSIHYIYNFDDGIHHFYRK